MVADLHRAAGSPEDDVPHGQAHVSRVGHGRAEARGLHVGALTHDDRLVRGAGVGEVVEQDLEEVVVDDGGVGYAHLVQLERPRPPERHLLEANEVRLGAGDLSGEETRPGGEAGLVDDGARHVRGHSEGCNDLLRCGGGRLGVQCRLQGSVDVRPEVEVAGHHRDRGAGWCRCCLRGPRYGDDMHRCDGGCESGSKGHSAHRVPPRRERCTRSCRVGGGPRRWLRTDVQGAADWRCARQRASPEAGKRWLAAPGGRCPGWRQVGGGRTRRLPDVPNGSSRGPRGAAAVLIGLQALALVGFAAYYLYELTIGEGSDATRVLMSALLILLGGVALALVALGWVRGASWPRTPTIVWNVLLVPVGVGLIQGDRALVGWTVVIVAVGATLAALGARDPDAVAPGTDSTS